LSRRRRGRKAQAAILTARVTELIKEQTMKTSTHYTDARGQHYLPECMKDREIVVDTIIAADYENMDPRDASEIMDACRALGIDTETDEDGALVAESVEESCAQQ
jgi:hypothetical protein